MKRLTQLLGMVAGLCLPLLAVAASYPEVSFILDASGSMLGMAGDKTKMAAAKEVMAQVVPGLAPEARVGLVAYGHRRKGDCTDIEVLIPAGSVDRAGLMDRVNALQPMGKTPITAAVGSVVEQLKTRENETTIVLVSDGIETCAADPCQMVGDLKAGGIKFVMHVVGLGVAGQGAEQLSCIAKAGGGQYLAASDAPTLLNALTQVTQEVTKKVEVEKARTTQVQAKTGLGKIKLNLPESATKGIAGLTLTRDGKVVKTTEGLTAESLHPLMPGEYEADLRIATPNYGEPTITRLGKVRVSPGETSGIALGAIVFNLPDSLKEGPAVERPLVGQVIVADAASGNPVVTVKDNGNGYYNFVPKAVLAGKYDILIQYANSPKPAIAARDVSVQAGGETAVTLDSGLRFAKVKDSGIIGWDLVPLAAARKADSEEDGDQAAAVEPLLQARPGSGNKDALWAPYLVPPGKYRLIAHVQGMPEPLPVAEELEIKAGELLNFDSGL